MKPAARPALTLVTFVATFYFVYWLPCSLLSLHSVPMLAPLASLASAAGAAHFVWKKTGDAPDALFACMGYGALLVGGIGFVLGFFGPMVFAPGANQGPLLGIFITGPGGALLGAVGGALYWMHGRGADARR